MARSVRNYTLALAVLAALDAAARPAGTAQAPAATPVRLPLEKVLPGPVTDYEVLQASSGFMREYLLESRRLPETGLTLRCTKGRSCADNRPWLLVRHQQTKKGLAVALAYPGNWQIRVEATPERNTRLRATTLPENLPVFETIQGLPVPGALVAEFTGDWDRGAQPLVRFIRARLRRSLGEDWPWVQYNTWYDRYAKLDEARLLEAARRAARWAASCSSSTPGGTAGIRTGPPPWAIGRSTSSGSPTAWGRWPTRCAPWA
jgi:alpha-galactosidase